MPPVPVPRKQRGPPVLAEVLRLVDDDCVEALSGWHGPGEFAERTWQLVFEVLAAATWVRLGCSPDGAEIVEQAHVRGCGMPTGGLALQEGRQPSRVADQRDSLAFLHQPLGLRHSEPGLASPRAADHLEPREVPPLGDAVREVGGEPVRYFLGLCRDGALGRGVHRGHEDGGELLEPPSTQRFVTVPGLDRRQQARRQLWHRVLVDDLGTTKVVSVVPLGVRVRENHEVLDAR